VATSLRWQFPDGCWLVDLAAVNTADAVPFAVAAGVGIEPPDSGDVIDHLTARIGRQRRLVIVDNCEHLLEAAGDTIEQLVSACPDLHVLATSREPVPATTIHVSVDTTVPVPARPDPASTRSHSIP